MDTIVYIDGFNLYYRAVRGTPYKWLDLEAFCDLLLPRNRVTLVRYFTAKRMNRPDDPGVRQRQEAYWRALRTLERIEIHEGRFKRKTVAGPRVDGDGFARIRCFEEKESDVNLASWLVLDAFTRSHTSAVVISNDSDLATPVRLVRDHRRLVVGIVNPDRSAPDQLSGDFRRPLRSWHLAQAQLPMALTDPDGTIRKPAGW